MKNAFFLTVMFHGVLLGVTFDTIYKTDSLDLLYEVMPQLSNQSLVIFDRDDTLLQGIDCVSVEQQNRIIALWKEIYTTEDPESLLRNIAAQQHVLVDNRAPDLIKKLQLQGVTVIILTRGCHGMGVTGKHVEDLCIDVLKKVDIDVQHAFAKYSGTLLCDVVHNGYSPLFKHGILFGNQCDKGETLEAFLKLTQFKPDCVIFIDDKLPYVHEVQHAMQKYMTPFIGLHYQAATKLALPDLRSLCYRLCYLLDRDLL